MQGDARPPSPTRPVRPRVLFLDHVRDVLGGAEINLLELAGHPRFQQSFQVRVACPSGGLLSKELMSRGISQVNFELPDTVRSFRLVDSTRSFFRRAWTALRSMHEARERVGSLLRTENPGLIVTIPNKDHLAAGPPARRLAIPHIAWFNDILSAEFFPWAARTYLSRSLSQCSTRVVTVSEFAASSLREHGVERSIVKVVPNGIDFPVGPLRDDVFRRAWGIPGECKLAGIVGRWTPWKGQELALRLARRMSQKGSEWHFALIGGVFNGEEEYGRKLEESARDGEMRNRIHLVPFQRDILKAVSQLDVLLHTSLKPEPFGRVIIEAMACGVPVVAAAAGGVMEIIQDGINGLLVSPGDEAAYEQALLRLSSDDLFRASLIHGAVETARAKYSLDRVVDDWTALLQEVAFA